LRARRVQCYTSGLARLLVRSFVPMRASLQRCSWIRALSALLVARENALSAGRLVRHDYAIMQSCLIFYENDDDPIKITVLSACGNMISRLDVGFFFK
jgi:hypothetical protein